MAARVLALKKVQGLTERYNDVLYSHPKSPSSRELLIFFGGDVQDTRENMLQHPDSKKYLKWNLENTAHIISERFPRKHVFVVRPSRMFATKTAVFSCYDNFVLNDQIGIPNFCPNYNALHHLQRLIETLLQTLKQLATKDVPNNIQEANVTLIGFSKGCVVLNQLLHEFQYYETETSNQKSVTNFIGTIKSIWWLDGGHGGTKDTWITDRDILGSFSKLKIDVHIHVTPYQVRDNRRPWIRSEESCFYETLRGFGVTVRRTVHFEDRPNSLVLHFNVLEAITDEC